MFIETIISRIIISNSKIRRRAISLASRRCKTRQREDLFCLLEDLIVSDSDKHLRHRCLYYLITLFPRRSFEPFKYVLDHAREIFECSFLTRLLLEFDLSSPRRRAVRGVLKERLREAYEQCRGIDRWPADLDRDEGFMKNVSWWAARTS